MMKIDFRGSSINAKLIVSFLAIALIPMLILSVIDSRIIFGAIRKNSLQAMQDVASLNAMEIEAFIDANLNNVRTESLIPTFRSYLEAPVRGGYYEGVARDILSALKKRDQVNILSYSLHGPDGRALISTTIEETDTSAGCSEAFRKASAGGLPVVSDVEFHSTPPVPSLFFSSPVRSDEGATIGYLVVRYNAAVLQRIIHRNTLVSGEKSSVMLIDDAAIQLGNSAWAKDLYRPMVRLGSERVMQLKKIKRLPADIRDTPAGRYGELEKWFAGKPRHSSFVEYLGIDSSIPMQCVAASVSIKPWHVICFRPEDDFLAAVRQQRAVTILALLFCSLAVTGIAFFIAKTISRPIIRLTSVADRIGRGDLQEKVLVSGADEIGRLGVAFNRMTENLNESRSRLLEATLRLHVILDTIPDAVFVHDVKGNILDVNRSTGMMYGFTLDEMLKLSMASLSGVGSSMDMALQRLANAQQNGSDDFEWTARKKDGTEFPVMIRLRSMRIGEEDLLIAVVTDVTELKKSEEEIKSSLKEKETLLRELYHRTKNNMQVISSLLRLQRSRLKNQEASDLFMEMENRIQSMALVHQKLYQSQTLSRIDLKDYIADLAGLILKSYQVSSGKVAVRLEMVSVPVLIDTAIPCGLIVNEMISNSLKYAFPGERTGELRIELEKKDETITLTVSDNGIGFPDGLNPRDTETLGLKNIIGLAEFQLGGTVDISSRDGVMCRIEFREERYVQRV
ncbi:MAG TPA: histidine kinase dimerization/phosphoacceptor domain -containing protein [Spirochaetota bacterium]|nr:histidine kinase dimerization/phosphoacceptor domain -containing protein [Spirochaetota bacterium]HPV41914.1 histidine kinase dimerization/phosphoacceptor domain -containing protein [Spirochaetota bacterium]